MIILIISLQVKQEILQQVLTLCWTKSEELCIVNLSLQGGPKKTAHSVYGTNFVYSQSFFIIFGTCTL